MNFLPEKGWARILVISAYTILFAITLRFTFSYVIAVAAPFALAVLVAKLLQEPIHCLHKRIGLPIKVIGFFLTLIVILFFVFVCVLLTNQLITEAQHIFVKLSESSELILNNASGFFENLGKRFPFIYEHFDREVIEGTATEVIKNVLTSLTSKLADILTGTVKALPGMILFLTVFVIAGFYLAMDYEGIKGSVKAILPQKTARSLSKITVNIKNIIANYLKAYGIILLITFAQLFIGFIITGIDYAMILALMISLLDMLPVIGTGTVLIPWAIISFILGNTQMAVAILIIFTVISVVREIIEPKIIGDCIGMHPLLTLISMYCGFKFFGVAGLILLPPAVMMFKRIIFQNRGEHTPL